LAYATGSTGLAITVRGSSRRIMIMPFRPANIRLINRRSNLPRLLLALSSGKSKGNYKNNPTIAQRVDTVTPYQANALIEEPLVRVLCELSATHRPEPQSGHGSSTLAAQLFATIKGSSTSVASRSRGTIISTTRPWASRFA
jgi:hypothetical protein